MIPALLLCVLVALALADSGRPPHFYQGNGFVDWDVGLDELSGHIAAKGDFNNDQSVDVVMVDQDRTIVSVLAWHDSDFRYRELDKIDTGIKVLSVAALDMDFDGNLDLLVVGESEDAPYVFHVYKCHRGSIGKTPIYTGQSATQPAVFAFTPDSPMALLGSDVLSSNITIWHKADKYSMDFETVQWWEAMGEDIPPFHDPATVVFADMDGDCRADLILATKDPLDPDRGELQLWMNRESHWKHRAWNQAAGTVNFKLPRGSGDVTVADMDGDGNLDLIIPVCYPVGSCTTSNAVHILYNDQVTLCGTHSTHGPCRSANKMCTSDPAFTLPVSPNISKGAYVTVPMPDGLFIAHPATDIQSLVVNIEAPSAVHVGDLTLHNEPSALFLVRDADDSVFASVWRSVRCSSETCTTEASQQRRATLERVSDDKYSAIEQESGVYSASFFDIDEDGTLDVLLQKLDVQNGKRTMTVKLNFLDVDAYFFKTFVLNGVCSAWCSHGPKFPDPKPYGAIQVGGAVKIAVTDLHGKKHPQTSVQMPRTSYLSLETPFSLMGLGRTNNYIEDCFVGVPRSGKASHKFTAMIPNSQVYFFTYPWNDPNAWTAVLLLRINESVKYVVIALLSTMAGLSGIIFYLNHRENVAERAERRKRFDHFVTF